MYFLCLYFFFFKQKTAYEMRISDWSSDVFSSDLGGIFAKFSILFLIRESKSLSCRFGIIIILPSGNHLPQYIPGTCQLRFRRTFCYSKHFCYFFMTVTFYHKQVQHGPVSW